MSMGTLMQSLRGFDGYKQNRRINQSNVDSEYAAAMSTKVFRGNFFKCGDETSHPHWASWSPISEELNFHRPETFGSIVLL